MISKLTLQSRRNSCFIRCKTFHSCSYFKLNIIARAKYSRSQCVFMYREIDETKLLYTVYNTHKTRTNAWINANKACFVSRWLARTQNPTLDSEEAGMRRRKSRALVRTLGTMGNQVGANIFIRRGIKHP